MMKAVILISGNGSNLQSIIDNSDSIDLQISAVISNNKNAYGLKRAKIADIETHFIDPIKFNTKENFDQELIKIIDSHGIELVVLAGYMRILTPLFVDHFSGKILNIHPSLLPKYKGLNTHTKAIQNKDKIAGCTVHFVTAKLDSGKIILQKKVKIYKKDTPTSLAKKVLRQEHKLYPMAIKKIFNQS